MEKVKVISFIFLLFIVLPTPSWAMSQCMESINFIEEYPVIFKGRVVSVEDNVEIKKLHDKIIDVLEGLRETRGEEGEAAYIWTTMFMGDPTITKFEVLETYKGILPMEVQLYHASKTLRGEPRRGGVSYKVGQTYVMLADIAQENRFTPGRCDSYYIPDSKNLNLRKINNLKSKTEQLEKERQLSQGSIDAVIKKAQFLERINDFLNLEKLYTEALKTYVDAPNQSRFQKGLQQALSLKEAYFEEQKNKNMFYVSAEFYDEGLLSSMENSFHELFDGAED